MRYLTGAVRGTGYGALALSAAMSAAAGLVAGQGALARARIPRPVGAPPHSDGTRWTAPGVRPSGRPLRLALLGDSLAAGLGADTTEQTLAAHVALRASEYAGRPVEITNAATVGSRSCDLRYQVETVAARRPHVALVIVGANDVTHRTGIEEAVRLLSLAVHRLQVLGAQVIVGTCPDLGTVSAIGEPLRHLARRQAYLLAEAQARAVRRAGAIPVDLFTQLGQRFRDDRTLFAADGFHPSPAGYAAAAALFVPSVRAVLLPAA